MSTEKAKKEWTIAELMFDGSPKDQDHAFTAGNWGEVTVLQFLELMVLLKAANGNSLARKVLVDAWVEERGRPDGAFPEQMPETLWNEAPTS